MTKKIKSIKKYIKIRMNNLYKLGCVINRRKFGDKHLSCEQHKAFKKDKFNWCDNCVYNINEK